MTFNYGEMVTLENGVQGQIWGTNGELVFVCIPNNEIGKKGYLYTKYQLTQLSTQ